MASNKKGLLEKELKYHLDRFNYFKLLRACKSRVKSTVSQTNYYFDDPKLKLRKKRFGLRIRITDGKKASITLKHPAPGYQSKQQVPSLKIRKEYEVTIPFKTAKKLLSGEKQMVDINLIPVKVLLDHFPKSYLAKIGVLGFIKTKRTFARIQKEIEIEIDQCRMFNQSFYELEVETESPKAADKTIRYLLKENNIPYHPINKSKLGRFLAQWKKIKKTAKKPSLSSI